MRKQIPGNEEIKLYSWMAQEGLKGNALVVYAIVYDAGEYSGGYRYLADFTGMEINSLIRLVGSMVKQGYLKLDLVDLLEDNALPVSLAYMYEERLEDIVVLPEDQQRAELLKIVQEAKRL